MSSGKILLVGLGPGAGEHMSLRARDAIAESDVVIGYGTYIKLVKDLLDGKEVVRKGMTEEVDRCVEAYEQAKTGKVVALVSSGDIGVYGMAGVTYEVLLRSGWTPDSDIEVELVPGSTALSACASLVGASKRRNVATSWLRCTIPRVAAVLGKSSRPSEFRCGTAAPIHRWPSSSPPIATARKSRWCAWTGSTNAKSVC